MNEVINLCNYIVSELDFKSYRNAEEYVKSAIKIMDTLK